MRHRTRKERYSADYEEMAEHSRRYAYWNPRNLWKRHMKKATARRNRRRPIEDETAYKRLDDPWYYY